MATLPRQPEVNIGTIGHVDHGKTTLVEAITGIWAARHSEEIRRGITIRLGYADAGIWECPKCEPPYKYTTKEVCERCGSEAKFRRAISFVDAPGHEILMTTMLSGAAVMDGALLVVAANEPCPQPQTREHLAAVEIVGVRNVVVVQNKIDLVTRDEALENYKQIKEFLSGTSIADAPIIPTSAQHKVNVEYVIDAIERFIPTPKRDLSADPLMYVIRSFDVNKPGTAVEDIVGGILGGTIIQGVFKVRDEIEIRPGVRVKEKGSFEPLYTEITSLRAGGGPVEQAMSGGLVGVGTNLDPSLTKADGLVGNVVGHPGKLPPVWSELTIESHLFERAIGTPDMAKVEKIKPKEPLVLNVGAAVTAGIVTDVSEDLVTISLRRPVCAKQGSRVAISRRIADRWRLIGYGHIV